MVQAFRRTYFRICSIRSSPPNRTELALALLWLPRLSAIMAGSSNATPSPAERHSGFCCRPIPAPSRSTRRAESMALGTIVVADDDAAIRTVLNQALSRAGYEVRLTSNAATLWRWVSRGDGDLVITDVVMPDENAFDLLPRIKRVRPDLPIIVMSAQNTFMTAIRASERGAYEYLPKPFDLKELVAIVGRALSRPRDAGTPSGPLEGEEIPLVGRSPAMQEIYRALARLMPTDLTVMITGESGTGKELVARALHDY